MGSDLERRMSDVRQNKTRRVSKEWPLGQTQRGTSLLASQSFRSSQMAQPQRGYLLVAVREAGFVSSSDV